VKGNGHGCAEVGVQLTHEETEREKDDPKEAEANRAPLHFLVREPQLGTLAEGRLSS
jgi:hypothetical protein